MDALINKTLALFWLPETKYVIGVFVVFALLAFRLLPDDRRRVRNISALFAICVAGQVFGAVHQAPAIWLR